MKISINIKEAKVEKKEFIFGIDLGTTNSLIAFVNKETGFAETLKEENKSSLVPSVIHFGNENKIDVGDDAKEFLVSDSVNTIYSVKRLLGKSYGDVKTHENYFGYKIIDDNTEQLVKIKVGEKFYSPIELSSLILTALKQRAEKLLNTEVKKVVITVPAYFNDSQRQATRDAGKLAGLEVLRIINEPTAAALAYGIGLKKDETKTIAVYDLGGGTFDISILKIQDGIFEVFSTNGDTYLGGDDFDRAIVENWMKEKKYLPAGRQVSSNKENQKSFSQQLRLLAEKAKKILTSSEIFEEKIGDEIFSITKNKFDELTNSLVERTINSCKLALSDAKLSKENIDVVVMVGGATRIPAVKNAVGNFFGKEVYDKLNPDEVVAIGAAIQADVLAGNNKDVLLLDVTPLSLGIETIGELMDTIIPRNSKIPTAAARQYTTSVDGQKNLRISVYQGERDLVRDNRKLAEFNLTNIPAMPAGFPKIEISFIINADGILTVKAKELRSDLEQSIEVKPQYGLTDEEVEKMLLASIQHAKEDMQTRAFTEAITEAKMMLSDTEKFILKNKLAMSDEEISTTKNLMEKLRASFSSNNKDAIQNCMDELNEFSKSYAERIMDSAIGEAMKGKKI